MLFDLLGPHLHQVNDVTVVDGLCAVRQVKAQKLCLVISRQKRPVEYLLTLVDAIPLPGIVSQPACIIDERSR